MEPGETQAGTVQITNTGDMNAKLVLSQGTASNGFSTPANLTLDDLRRGHFDLVRDLRRDEHAHGPRRDFTPGETHTYTFTVTLSASTPDIDQGKLATSAFTFTSTPVPGQDPVNTWG